MRSRNLLFTLALAATISGNGILHIWLAAQKRPDFVTINRFCNRVKNEIAS